MAITVTGIGTGRTTQPILRATPIEGGAAVLAPVAAPIVSAPAAPVYQPVAAPSAPATTLPSADSLIQQAVDAGAQVAQNHGTGNDIQNAIVASLQSQVASGALTQSEVDAVRANDGITGTGAWGNGAVPTTTWLAQVKAAFGLGSAPTSITAPPPAIVNVNGGTTTTSPDPTTTPTQTVGGSVTATPSPAAPTSTDPTTTGASTTDNSDLASSFLQSLIGQLNGTSAATDGTTSGSTVPGDVSALNAASPVTTGPVATSSGANPEALLIVGGIVAGGLVFWLWHKHKHPAPAAH